MEATFTFDLLRRRSTSREGCIYFTLPLQTRNYQISLRSIPLYDILHVLCFVAVRDHQVLSLSFTITSPALGQCFHCLNASELSLTLQWRHTECDGSQIASLMIVYSTIYSGADQRKHQSSTSLAFVRGIHRGPMNSTHEGPVTRKMFPFDDVIMEYR